MLQGDRGYSRKGEAPGNASRYYSYTRLAADGELRFGDQTPAVTGSAWLDREWSTSALDADQAGWDWFALQLDDGTDIMLYQLFDSDGLPVLMSGTAAQDGHTTVLTETDFEVTVTGRWTSPKTGIEYPMGWTVAVPSKSLQVSVSPLVRNSEFDGRTTSYKVYWEGPVEISGSHSGIGFVEMSGYKKAAAAAP